MRKVCRVLIVALALMLATPAAWAADRFEIQVNGEDANAKTFQLDLSQSAHLAITEVCEGKWADCKVEWSSRYPSVAYVELGMVYAQRVGTTRIRATAEATSGAITERYLIVQVVGSNPDATTVTVRAEGGVTSVPVGETLQLIAQVTPAGTALKWTCNAASVASVDQDGLVTAKKAGKARVTATAQDGSGASASIALTVQAKTSARSVKLNRHKAVLYVGGVTSAFRGSVKLSAVTKPAGAASSLEWSSSDESVVSVSDGRVTAHKAGTATVRASNGGKSDTCHVTVHKLPTKVQLPASGRLRVGEKVNLAKRMQIDGTVTRVRWQSSDRKVARVTPKGVVLGVHPGKAYIRVSTVNGKTARCAVQVIS